VNDLLKLHLKAAVAKGKRVKKNAKADALLELAKK